MFPTKGWGPTASLLAFFLFFTIGCEQKDGDGPAATAATGSGSGEAPSATNNGSREGSASRRLPNVEVLRLLGVGRQEGAADSGTEGNFTPQPVPAGGGGAANE